MKSGAIIIIYIKIIKCISYQEPHFKHKLNTTNLNDIQYMCATKHISLDWISNIPSQGRR